ncbi:MAG: choice-of-anchor tandem repeat NxxGxxAF-containing protein, partial [Planctomycetota bacterium]
MGWEGIGFRRSGVWAVGLIAAVWGGVASAAPGVNNILVQTGLTAPDFNGTYSSFFSPTLNDAGQVAFSSALTGTSGGITDNSGLYVVGDGGDTQIAREGQAVPGGNGTFSSLFIVPQFNQSGQVAFLANLSGTTGGTTDNSAVYLFNGGGLTQVVREGQSSPDGNGTFEGFGNPVLNDLGQVAVSGFLTGTSGSFFDDSGVYRGSGGTLTQISREDQAAPDGNGVLSGGLFDIRINDVGGVVFNSFVSGTTGGGTDNEGIFLGSGGALTQVIRKGQAAPDGNGVVSSLFEPAVNNSGQVAVYTFLDGTSNGGADDRALYLSSGGTLARIAREGESA